MKLKIYGISDKGSVRDHNEDMVLIDDIIFRDDKKELEIDLKEDNKKLFIAVADGMGGHNAGEIASEIVVAQMADTIAGIEKNLEESALREVLTQRSKEIHRFILDEGAKDPGKKGMGSTLIGVLFYEEKVFYMNVGDSRLYRFRRGNLMQISKDHSLKEISGDENVNSNILMNSFGAGERIDIEFERVGGKIIDGDLLLLCSDGLSDELTDDEIEEILEGENPLENLMIRAKERGGNDNISYVLTYISES